MAGGSQEFIVDTQGGGLVSSFLSTKSAIAPRFVAGDITPVSARITKPSTNPDLPWEEVDLTGKKVKVSVGKQVNPITGGTFTITYGGDTTSAIAYNATAATVQTALNDLASITSAGGVTVTQTGTAFRVAFVSDGVITAITANAAGLTPASESAITTIQAGTVSAKGIYVVRFKASPASSIILDDEVIDSIAIDTTQEGVTDTTQEIQTITFGDEVYGGFFTLAIGAEKTVMMSISTLSTPSQFKQPTASIIQTSLRALPAITTGVTVTGVYPRFTATFASSLGNVAEIVADTTEVLIPKRKSGLLNNSDIAFLQLLGSESSVGAVLEIEIIDDTTGNKWTPILTACTVSLDV